MIILLIAVCGGLGAALRYIVDTLLQQRAGVHPALSILLINALGSFLIGFSSAASVQTSAVIFAVITAACGGFTTFSTASLDTYKLLRQHAFGLAIGHALGQLAVCVALAFAGYFLASGI